MPGSQAILLARIGDSEEYAAVLCVIANLLTVLAGMRAYYPECLSPDSGARFGGG